MAVGSGTKAVKRLGLALCAGASLFAMNVSAQNVPIEEIVVTAPNYVPTKNVAATKMEVPLIETPQSITVVPRDQIDLLRIQNVSQAVRYSAGVTGENFGPDARFDGITLRGFAPTQYIDGLQAPFGSTTNVGLDLYGFESLEVLKGPSSVLYGAAPPGGLINLTSRRPKDVFGGEIGIQYGDVNSRQVMGDITGPITDKLLFRLTALRRESDSSTDIVKLKRTYIAPAVTWLPTDSTSLTILSYYQKDHDPAYGSSGFLPASGTIWPNPNGQIPYDVYIGEPNESLFDREQSSIGYDFSQGITSWLTFKSNAKWFSYDSETRSIYGTGIRPDQRTVNRARLNSLNEIHSVAMDNRVEGKFDTGPLQHTALVGFDFRRVRYNAATVTGTGTTIDVFNPVYNLPLPVLRYPAFVNQIQRQYGVYVQDQIKYDDRWVLTGALRQDSAIVKTSTSSVAGHEPSYRIGLNYLFDSGFAPYVAYAKSFQTTAGTMFGGQGFLPTVGKQAEAGVKYEAKNLPRGIKAFGSVAVYDLKQSNALTTDTAHPGFSIQTGEVEVKGVEVEGVARFNERLSLNMAYSYTQSKITKSNAADLGKQLIGVPKQKLSLLADYTQQEGPLAGLGGGVGMRYTSRGFGDATNQIPFKSFTFLDAIVHYDIGNWRAVLNASNLLDKKFVARCTSVNACYYGTERTLTATLLRKF